ncbi:HAD-IIIC family phosphatase [Azospirillum sp. Vi22]|uniref:HAD-IIIC family phosphatase n=1 Tax=Azospirillum baldaniorum TaxID=1064539 RepID=UPI00157B2EF5|nr:HAD-IIIC family phosphatase [Azospirillum baldaniorum]NUB07086.1 HAD-IIIC family phosphatase [Azospirillum baldaniorum]
MPNSSILDLKVSEDDVDEFFRLFLGRNCDNQPYKAQIASRELSARTYISALLGSNEFADKFISAHRRDQERKNSGNFIDGDTYRIPDYLTTSGAKISKVLFIGSCLLNSWAEELQIIHPETSADRIVFNNASTLPDIDADKAEQYAFQIVQIPIRFIIPEGMYFSLKHSDLDGHKTAFEAACHRIDLNLDYLLAYNKQHGIPTFVLGFMPPQQNPTGRLQPRYSLNNMVFFFEELNRHLYNSISKHSGVYYIDVDQIAGTYGKKRYYEDSITHLNHGSLMRGFAMRGDENRLEPIVSIEELYRPDFTRMVTAIYAEAVACYRTIMQRDSVKLVIFDLDDTLWRGVAADADDIGDHMTETWPLGILEAAAYLWKRGILLAIASKNDETTARKIWSQLYEQRFSLKNFAAVKINWLPKAQNISDILAQVNILPQNVLFVDDNPVERAAVKQALPGIRVMDAPLPCWRRILLWSAETQQATITEEGVERTSMIQAQIEREETRAAMGRQEFLDSLGLTIEIGFVTTVGGSKYDRCFELINKTNQFNTTGRRWTTAEFANFVSGGGRIITADVQDKFTAYGTVGIILVRENIIEQYVLSCRVFGMDVEHAIIRAVGNTIRASGFTTALAELRETERNKLCLNIFKDNGYTLTANNIWLKSIEDERYPGHIAVTVSPT